uniref:HNH nuclease domain-containing protein n=1 Tax=Mycena chlorophos TaxID=658473 RepID=A0ABQ0M9H5_MYCCL|nr:predicted protein [Mycena chlorophos]
MAHIHQAPSIETDALAASLASLSLGDHAPSSTYPLLPLHSADPTIYTPLDAHMEPRSLVTFLGPSQQPVLPTSDSDESAALVVRQPMEFIRMALQHNFVLRLFGAFLGQSAGVLLSEPTEADVGSLLTDAFTRTSNLRSSPRSTSSFIKFLLRCSAPLTTTTRGHSASTVSCARSRATASSSSGYLSRVYLLLSGRAAVRHANQIMRVYTYYALYFAYIVTASLEHGDYTNWTLGSFINLSGSRFRSLVPRSIHAEDVRRLAKFIHNGAERAYVDSIIARLCSLDACELIFTNAGPHVSAHVYPNSDRRITTFDDDLDAVLPRQDIQAQDNGDLVVELQHVDVSEERVAESTY